MSKPEADKPIVWLRGEVKTPPFSKEARIEVGCLLRLLQRGETLALPHSRPMPAIGPRCHELRVNDAAVTDEKMVLTPSNLTPEGVIKLSMGKKKHVLLKPA